MFDGNVYKKFRDCRELDDDASEAYFDPVNPLGTVKFEILKDPSESDWHPTLDDPPDLSKHFFGKSSLYQGGALNERHEDNLETMEGNFLTPFGSGCFPSRSKEELSTLQARIDRASVDVYKKADLERISTDEAVLRAKKLADVKTEKELQPTRLFLGKDGTVRLCKECFFGRVQMVAPFKLKHGFAIYCCEEMQEKILHAIFMTATEKRCELYLRISDVCEKKVNRKLNALGIHFGLSNKNETENRLNLINELIEWSEEVMIPYQPGWNKKDEAWYYVFPGELNWKELEKNV